MGCKSRRRKTYVNICIRERPHAKACPVDILNELPDGGYWLDHLLEIQTLIASNNSFL